MFKSLLVACRQRREEATASKVFFLVAMDEEGWGYNAHRWVTLQEVYRIKPGLSPDIGQVLEVPTHKIIEPGDRTDRYMPGVVGIGHR